jgi:hypothetical protein
MKLSKGLTSDFMNDDLAFLGLAIDTYHAYGLSVGFKNDRGLPMPQWIDLPELIKTAWIAAARCAFERGESQMIDRNVEMDLINGEG